ncbi:MAG: hypothetical protein WBK20_10850 [Spirochaetota bacterium]
MSHIVALTQYDTKGSVKKAIELSRAFQNLKPFNSSCFENSCSNCCKPGT